MKELDQALIQTFYTYKLEQALIQRFYTYLCYDQQAHRKFEDPSSKNSEYWDRVRKDAESMANLVIRELEVRK
jgi:hypothetical protein